MRTAIENWHRRQAIQIVHQLPEEHEDALKIMECLNFLIGYMYGIAPAGPGGGGGDQVLRFPGASSSPNLRASSVGSASILPK